MVSLKYRRKRKKKRGQRRDRPEVQIFFGGVASGLYAFEVTARARSPSRTHCNCEKFTDPYVRSIEFLISLCCSQHLLPAERSLNVE